MGEEAYFGFDCVFPTPPYLPHQKKTPHPFSLSSCETRLFWQNQLAELIFKKKRPRQNWSRGQFEATQRAKFSILQPNFWSGDEAMGMTHWHNPNRVNISAIYSKITILLGEIHIFTSIVLDAIFGQIFRT